jgi:hypothetical protein
LAIGAGSNAAGKLEMPLTVELWNSASFGIGGIALSTETRPTEGLQRHRRAHPRSKDVGRWWRAADNLFPSPPIVSETPATFSITPKSSNQRSGGANPSTLKIEVRVLDGKAGQLRQDTGMAGIAGYVHPGNPVVPFAIAVPVAELPAGSYRLEVRAMHSSGPEVVARTVDFEVN